MPATLRGLAIGALTAFAGLLGFLVTRRAPAPQPRAARLVRRLALATAVLVPLHLVAWALAVSPDHSLGGDTIAALLASGPGRVELGRTVLALLAAWALLLVRRERLALFIAFVAILAGSATGHSAAIHPEWGIPGRALHLLAVAAWLGGLLWLVTLDRSDAPAAIGEAQRVSSLALVAVIVVTFSGVVQTRLFLPVWGDLVGSRVRTDRAGQGRRRRRPRAVRRVSPLSRSAAADRRGRRRGLPALAAPRDRRDVVHRPPRRPARLRLAADTLTFASSSPLRHADHATVSSLLRRARAPHRSSAASLAVACIALQAAPALAHVTVWPRTAAPGGFERYVVRVPNEKNTATTRVEIHFPAEVRISSFLDVPGWNLQVLTDSAGKITGAVWTGTLPPKRFVEFPFIGVNPKTGTTRLVWPAFQTYADGEVVQWTGPDRIQAARVGDGADDAAGGRSLAALWVAIAALVVALAGLGLALRRPEPAHA